MRTWLYDILVTDTDLLTYLGITEIQLRSRVVPRESALDINFPKPFLVYGLGNNTNEDLAEDLDHEAHRQFFQVWVHDEGGSFFQIDDMVALVKKRLNGKSHPASKITTVRWLETSQEFSNETFNTIFRYVRFQAIISKGVPQT